MKKLIDFFHFYNSEYLLTFQGKIQPNIPSGSGKVDFVIFAIFNNAGHLRYSTCPNFTILRPWSQVKLHVKFENCRSGGFIEDV